MGASTAYRGRFAPSPTGPLHFGSLLAAMASFCEARSRGGEWLLRIEDLDPPRERPGAAGGIIETLRAFGFHWDGVIVYQSQRGSLYQAAMQSLVDRGLVFPCACSRSELLHAPLSTAGEHVYPGTCRKGLPPGTTGRAWRVRVGDTRISFADDLQGTQTQELATEVGDFVVRRADGWFAYHLAVVADDAEQGVSHVVRGADLLPSTARQIYLQRLLGFDTPKYLHVPVATNARGEKLSKQTLAPALNEHDPVPELRRAWAFLGQAAAPQALAPDHFWRWALRHWRADLLPRRLAMPATV